jgi:hypothetical protein
MILADLLGKIKKSLEDDEGLFQHGHLQLTPRIVSPIPQDQIVSPIPKDQIVSSVPKSQTPQLTPLDKLKNAIGESISSTTEGIKSYFDPTKSGTKGFWGTPLARGAANFQRSIEQKTLPMVNLTQYAKGIKEPVPRFGAELGLGVAEDILNIPQRLLYGVGRTEQDLRTVLGGGKITPERAIGTAAEVALPLIDIYTLGRASAVERLGNKLLGQAAKEGLKNTIKRNAIEGGLLGIGYGALRGAAEGDEAKLGNVLKNATVGGLLGAGIGGTVGGVGGIIGLLKRSPQVEKELIQRARTQPRDLKTGQWVTTNLKKPKGMTQAQWDFQLKFNKKYGRNPYDPVYYGDVAKAIEEELKKNTKDRSIGLSIRDVSKDVSPFEEKATGQVAEKVKPKVSAVQKAISPEFEPLAEWLRNEIKAGRIKSAEEFVKAYRPSSVRGPSAEKIEQAISKQRENLVPFNGPVGKVTIYRGGTGKDIVPGDFVTTNKEVASLFNKNVVSKIVDSNDLMQNYKGDLVYAPNGIKSLTDFYNLVTKGIEEVKQTPQEAPSVNVPPVSEKASQVEVPVGRKLSQQVEKATKPAEQIAELPKEQPIMGGGQQTPPSENTISQGFKERGVMRTIRTSETTPPELTKEIEKITGSTRFYKPYSDIASLKDAQSRIATEGVDNVKKAVLEGEYSKENVAAGEILVSKALNEGRIDEATEIIKNLSMKATQAGQANQAWSMWSRMTPAGFLKYAESEVAKAAEKMGSITKSIRGVFGKKPPELTTEDKKIIKDYMTKANQAATDEEKAKFVKLAMQTVADKIPLGVSDVLDAYRYNNMLSGLPTHERNFFNNVWNTFITPALTLAAEGRPKQAILYEFNAIKNIPKGLDMFVKSMRREIPIDLGKIDLSMERVKYEKLPRPLTIFSDLMEASDKLFSGIIESSMVAAGKTPEEAARLAQEYLVRTPLQARGYGFLSDKVVRAMGDGIQAFGNKFKPVKWAVPFLRSPFNWAAMQLEYSPLGIANLVGENLNKRTTIARALLGSGATLIGAKLALEGRTTWAAPTDPEEKKWFYATGRKPFSVKIGDKWIPAYYFGPFAFAILLPAAAHYYYKEAPDALSEGDWEKLGKTIASAIYYWSQSSPLAGLGGFVRTLEGDIDYSFSKNLAFNVSQIIPFSSMLRYITNIFDPIYRKPQDFVEQLKTNIPGLSQTIQQTYQEPTGEPARRDITNYILPWAIGTETPESQLYEPFYRERQQERQQTRLINTLKKQIEEGQPIGEEEAALLYGKQIEKTGEPLSVLAERVKLQAQYKKANDLFELYLKAPDEATRTKIEQSIAKMGIDPTEGLYNYLTTQETDPKTDYIKAIIAQNPDTDIIELLSPYRKEGIASGKPLLSDSVIDNLYDEELITAEQKKYLRSLKWDAKQKKVILKRKGTAKTPKIPKVVIKKAQPIKIAKKIKIPSSSQKRKIRIKIKKLKEVKV